MTSASRLRQAARRCELGALEQLSAACGIVIDTGRLIHALQKERGCSAIYLASEGRCFAADRSERIADSQSAELVVRRRLTELAELPEQTAQGARLLRRGAEVWQALDALERVRGAVATRRTTPDDATRDYNGLIGGLMGLVFEAADGGGDTRITLALVALFHLLKGKELAGQERACGAHGFTAGGFDATHRRLLARRPAPSPLIGAPMEIIPITAEDFARFWPTFRAIVQARETYALDPELTYEQAYRLWCEQPQFSFVARAGDEVLGGYYLKPNAAGPGDHICNCGYMVTPQARGKGVARAMCEHSQQVAIEAGYLGMQFNAVVVTNEVAIRLWQTLGFEIIGTVPGGYRHRELGLVDTRIMYKRLAADA